MLKVRKEDKALTVHKVQMVLKEDKVLTVQ
jgi:hypothetical protein